MLTDKQSGRTLGGGVCEDEEEAHQTKDLLPREGLGCIYTWKRGRRTKKKKAEERRRRRTTREERPFSLLISRACSFMNLVYEKSRTFLGKKFCCISHCVD